jgi:NAD(P)-dependent dehydrogenase (short-subunit alcohol dehydrogenase family)
MNFVSIDRWMIWSVLIALMMASFSLVVPRLGDRQRTWGCSSTETCSAAVLITGASSGLGRHAAFHLASNGFTVFATVRKDSDAESLLTELDSKFSDATGSVVPIKMDVTDDASVGMAAATIGHKIETKSLNLAGIVNNAGVLKRGTVAEMTPADYEWNFSVNVFGLVRVTRAFLPLLRRGSRIVNIGSAAGVLTNPKMLPYGATKFALEGISDVWRQELAFSHGISVSLVQPGFVKSKMCDDPGKCDEGGLIDVSTAIHHAIAAEYPKARYPVAWVGIAPTWAGVWLRHIIPDRVYDRMVQLAMKVQKF